MNNLITVFLNYKVSRLASYGTLIYNEDSEFINRIFKNYFQIYVDNYYYGIFHTVDNGVFNKENLKLEFDGIEKEMLDEYLDFELIVSNEEYSKNTNDIKEIKKYALELVDIDLLEIKDKDDIPKIVEEFVNKNKFIKDKIDTKLKKLTSLVRSTYQANMKMMNYKEEYFSIDIRKFFERDDLSFYSLKQTVKILDNYKKGMVLNVYEDNRLDVKKSICLIQKISLEILKKFINHEEIKPIIIELRDDCFKRGNLKEEVLEVLDNPLLEKYLILGVNHNTYLADMGNFDLEFSLACIQDYTHINDVYQKTETILNEGAFDYLIVSDYKYRDRDFFVKYENASLEVLLFEEE